MSPSPILTVRPCVKPFQKSPSKLDKPSSAEDLQKESSTNRRACGCVRTSEKLRNILKTFPQPPPPSPMQPFCKTCKDYVHINSMGVMAPNRFPSLTHTTYIAGVPAALFVQDLASDLADARNQNNSLKQQLNKTGSIHKAENSDRTIWVIVKELISLIQVSVTATALVIYYLIYCYMQLIYYTLRSAVYFHQADAFMKITIAVATITALVVSLYFIMRLENLVGIHLRDVLRYI